MDDDEEEPGSYESESRGCLVILASYADLAGTVGPVASEAARRIMMSPALGDFVELRYASLGPRPRQDYERPFAVSRMAAEISRPTAAAAQNYFAMAIIDSSAATIERFLADCASSPVISALPLRRCGFAATDDRMPAGESAKISPPIEMLIPRDHQWTERTLTNALRRYAEKMLLDFGTGHERGLTPEQLDVLRADVGSALASPLAQPINADRELDLLPDEQGPDDPELSAEKPAPQARSHDQPDDMAILAGIAAAPIVTSVPEVAASEPTAAPRPRRSHVNESTGSGPARPEGLQRRAPALLFLAPVGGATSGDRMRWERARSLLRELDSKLAGERGPAWKVRFAPDPSRIKESELKDAGRLSRRDFRRTPASLDFARSLAAIRTVLNRDLAAFERSAATAQAAAIVLFAIEAPLADAVTAKEYEQLADLARVIWVVPESMTDLMSPVFAAGGRIFIDYPGVGEELISLLKTSTASSSSPLASAATWRPWPASAG